MKYSTGFRNNVIKKILPPENRSIAEVSKETGVCDQTIRNWLIKLKNDNGKKFALHKEDSMALNCKVYFAKPNHSRERCQNANGLIGNIFPNQWN